MSQKASPMRLGASRVRQIASTSRLWILSDEPKRLTREAPGLKDEADRLTHEAGRRTAAAERLDREA